ncbi:hypothetical protein WMF27_21325 [Sorangium sp. So ce281]|uniref:hypothetical protein n=1 Tax=Sorangium sp. So ce281 TaxID=3133293 RepID=UPI003F606781
MAIMSVRAAWCASPMVVDHTFAASLSQCAAYDGSAVELPTRSSSMAYERGSCSPAR